MRELLARIARSAHRSWSPRTGARISAQPLREICLALRELAERYAGSVRIVYPVHRNPNVWGPVHELLGDVPHITLRPPLDYLPEPAADEARVPGDHRLGRHPGGGAPAWAFPALVLREVTERPEGVDDGRAAHRRHRPRAHRRRSEPPAGRSRTSTRAWRSAENPFGDGHAAERIVASLLDDPGDADRELLREQRFCAYLKV